MNQTNEPLDVDYFSKKLKSIVRDFSSYRADELSRELSKLSVTACPTNTITIPAAEYAKLKEDAERYQCLRELDWIDDQIMLVYHINQDNPETLDNAVDDAIQEGK